MKTPAAVAVGVLAFAAAGCATKADVQTLESSLVDEMAQVRDDQVRLVQQMRAAIDSLNAAEARRASTGQGELDRRVQRLESSLTALLDITNQNNQLLNDILSQRGSSMAMPVGVEAGGDPGLDPMSAGTSGMDSDTQFYALALEEFRKGNNETARGALEEFLSQSPDHELAPDAYYHIARTYEEQDDIASALTAYQRVTELFPNSNRSPAALYRRGLIEVERGNTAVARRLFTQITSGYPNTPEESLAREELAKLGG
jgi:tol-pal system protein YbgF